MVAYQAVNVEKKLDSSFIYYVCVNSCGSTVEKRTKAINRNMNDSVKWVQLDMIMDDMKNKA